MTATSITVRKGNDKDIPLQIKDGQINLDLTGATVELMVKEAITDADGSAKITLAIGTGIVVTDAKKGKITAVFVPTDTSTLAAKTYSYDIRIITAASKEYTTEVAAFIVSDVVNRL